VYYRTSDNQKGNVIQLSADIVAGEATRNSGCRSWLPWLVAVVEIAVDCRGWSPAQPLHA